MSTMSDKLPDPILNYSTREVADFVDLSDKHVGRLVDQGYFPGSRRKSPHPRSPRVIPGSAVIEFLKNRQAS